MKIPFLDLKTQYHNLKKDIDNKIFSLIETSSFIGGKEIENFSKNFSDLIGSKNFVPLANGTDALYVSMKNLGIGFGDEVITTSSSWISTSETISQTGAKPVFVDIDDYYCINSDLIENKITKKTKAIIPVHLYGQMCDMDKILEIAKKHDLYVIEDCAQSHFSKFNGHYAGTFGDVGTFSFYPGKNLGAYGDAGGVITNNNQLALKIKRFANHGALIKHNHEVEGINSRMDTLQAGVLNVKLPYIISWTNKREAIANRYLNLLQSNSNINLPKIRPNTNHSFHVFAICINKRDELKKWLLENGISSQIHYPLAMPFMKAYAYLNAQKSDYPNSYNLQSNELSLPIFPEMTFDQVDYVVETINKFKF